LGNHRRLESGVRDDARASLITEHTLGWACKLLTASVIAARMRRLIGVAKSVWNQLFATPGSTYERRDGEIFGTVLSIPRTSRQR
jgi:hypothetical protein